jgi:histidinol-phosphatase (PHP family)
MGSLHHVNNIPIDFDKKTFDFALQSYNNDMEALSLQYFEDQFNLIKKFHPKVIGHFDLIKLFAPQDYQFSSAVKEKIDRNIRYIVDYGGLFEINTRSLKKSLPYPYPQPDILKVSLFLD